MSAPLAGVPAIGPGMPCAPCGPRAPAFPAAPGTPGAPVAPGAPAPPGTPPAPERLFPADEPLAATAAASEATSQHLAAPLLDARPDDRAGLGGACGRLGLCGDGNGEAQRDARQGEPEARQCLLLSGRPAGRPNRVLPRASTTSPRSLGDRSKEIANASSSTPGTGDQSRSGTRSKPTPRRSCAPPASPAGSSRPRPPCRHAGCRRAHAATARCPRRGPARQDRRRACGTPPRPDRDLAERAPIRHERHGPQHATAAGSTATSSSASEARRATSRSSAT